jgi:hypothetical protein
VSKGPRRSPDRRATRRGPGAGRPTSPSLTLHAAPGPSGDLEVVLDPELLAAGLVGNIASEMVRGVADARTPLDAELALSPLLGMLERLAPEESTADDRAAMRRELLTGLVAWAESNASPAALAFLRVATVLGDQPDREQAEAAANRLAATGLADRPWAPVLGRPDLIRAWRYSDVFGEQESVALEYDYYHRQHVVSGLIDHQLGGGIKDCWVADGRKARALRDRTADKLADNPMAVFEDIGADDARRILTSALAQQPCPVQDDQIQDVTRYIEVLRSRVRTLAEPAG